MDTLTIVTAAYALNYEETRSGGLYKNFCLLTETLDALITNENFNFIVYTDKKTYDMYNLKEKYNKPNIELRFKELNSDTYVNILNPIREKNFNESELYDRIYTVKNYIEVILNKLDILLENSHITHEQEKENEIVWIDAGLFGTSCSPQWRDEIKKIIYNDSIFLDKISEKIKKYGFICTKGNTIAYNYEVRDKVRNMYNIESPTIIAGCLFGGKKYIVNSILSEYKSIFLNYVTTFQELISEQELLDIVTYNNNVKYYEFNDWDDLQKAFLKIMDIYDEFTYSKDKPPT